jgi:Xaa-Pro aminopeptidase
MRDLLTPPRPSIYAEHRERLLRHLPVGAVCVAQSNDHYPTNADAKTPFIQNNDLFWLTGIAQEETIIMIAPGAFDPAHREVLFILESTEQLKTWEGAKITKEQASEISGIKTVKWTHEFPGIFHTVMCEAEEVFLTLNEHARSTNRTETREARFAKETQMNYPLHRYRRLSQVLARERMVKNSEEVEMIQDACRLTESGMNRVARMLKPGVNEREVEAEFSHEFVRGFGGFAYEPIIAAGESACILHYIDNNQTCEDGSLLLLDVAARKFGYMSDMTRTLPISGKFSERQRAVYDAVLRTFYAVRDAMRPGVTTRDLRRLCEELTAAECVGLGLIKPGEEVRNAAGEIPALKPYFMHGVAHHIGLDVHDVGPNSAPLAPGHVLTVEPAIYIQAEAIGIRIENTVLVTDGAPVDLMPGFPLEADEIEALMASK